jgi:hypothetical protein
MTLTSAQSLAVAGVVGLLSGTHTAIWGMYKDAVHEGFTIRRFVRSMLIGAVVAVMIQAVLHLALPAVHGLVVLFGLAYAAERGTVEVWKTFLREEDQSKYFIPMQFSVRGVPVASRAVRMAIGAAYVAAIAGCLVAIARLDLGDTTLSPLTRAALAGLAVGAIVAVGGGWKDAPKEGFDALKFFRSPAMTVFYALLLSRLTESSLVIAVAAIGYERATAETYKTFFFSSKPRGKFMGKPVLHPQMLQRRIYFIPAYVAISLSAVVSLTLAVAP